MKYKQAINRRLKIFSIALDEKKLKGMLDKLYIVRMGKIVVIFY